MPLSLSTLRELGPRIDRRAAERLGVSQVRLQRSVLGLILGAVKGVSQDLHADIGFLALQPFFSTATGEFLDRLADRFLGGRRGATAAAGIIQVTFSAALQTLPINTLFSNGGQLYRTVEPISSSAGNLAVNVRIQAVELGVIGNRDASAQFTLERSLAFVDDIAVTIDAVDNGQEAETDDQLRARGLSARRTRVRVGTLADWVFWTISPQPLGAGIPGATRAWAFSETAGQIIVLYVKDGDPNSILPTAQEILDARPLYDLVRPAGLTYEVRAPLLVDMNPTLTVSLSPGAQLDVIEQAVSDYIDSVDLGGVVSVSQIIAAATAAGASSITVDSLAGQSPGVDVTLDNLSLPIPGVFTYG